MKPYNFMNFRLLLKYVRHVYQKLIGIFIRLVKLTIFLKYFSSRHMEISEHHVQSGIYYPKKFSIHLQWRIAKLSLWNEELLLLSPDVFGLVSSSLLLWQSRRFDRYILRTSSSVRRFQ